MKKSVCAIVACVLVAALGGAAQAGNSALQLPRDVTVSFSDLDLSQPGAMGVLQQRIHDAAMAVCQPRDYPFNLGGSSVWRAEKENAACIDRVTNAAMTRVSSALDDSARTRMAAAGN